MLARSRRDELELNIGLIRDRCPRNGLIGRLHEVHATVLMVTAQGRHRTAHRPLRLQIIQSIQGGLNAGDAGRHLVPLGRGRFTCTPPHRASESE